MKIDRKNPFEGRLKREFQTIMVMVGIYCEGNHGKTASLCSECSRLLDYAESKIDVCPFGTSKPQCNKCEIHCYVEPKRIEVKKVMRYAGPRMLYKHPIMTILHYADALKDGSREKAKELVKARRNQQQV